jgi:hypothetical protein
MDAILTGTAEQLATEMATHEKTLEDLNGPMKLMMKSALERMLDAELDVHLGRKRLPGSAAHCPAQVAANSAAEAPRKKGANDRHQGQFTKYYRVPVPPACLNWSILPVPLGNLATTPSSPPRAVTIRRSVEICMSDCFSSFDRLGCLMPSTSTT